MGSEMRDTAQIGPAEPISKWGALGGQVSKWLVMCCVGNFALVLGGLIFYRTEHFSKIVARLSGESLVVAEVKSVGALRSGRHYTVRVPLANIGRRLVTVAGCQTSCSCAVLRGFPLTLQPGVSRSLDVDLSTVGKTGPLVALIDLFSDDPISGVKSFRITGTVVSDPSSAVGLSVPH